MTLSAVQQKANQKILLTEVLFFSVMLALGESYLGAYAIFLKANPLIVGFIGAAPIIMGSIGQLSSLKLSHSYSSGKILKIAVLLEAVFFLLLILPLACNFNNQILIFTLIATGYFYIRNITIPVFNELFRVSVPADIRGVYSGQRQKRSFLLILLCLPAAGAILQIAEKYGYTQETFLILILLAAVSRFLSYPLFYKLNYQTEKIEKADTFSLYNFIRIIRRNNFGRFVLMTAAVNFSANLIGGFFAVYIFTQLKFSYWEFACLITTGWLFQYLSIKFWGQLIDQLGSRLVIIICCYGVTLVPLMYLINDSFIWLILVKIVNGTFWGGYNLATSNYVYDAVSGKNFVKCQAYSTVVNSISVISAILLSGSFQSYAYAHQLIDNPFIPVFVISLIFRLSASVFLAPRIKEVKHFPEGHKVNLCFRLSGLNIIARANFSFICDEKKK